MEIKGRDKKKKKKNKQIRKFSKFRAVSIFLWLFFSFFFFFFFGRVVMLMFLFLSSFDPFLFHSLFRSFSSSFLFLTFSLPFGSYGWWVTWLSFWYSETENKKDTPPVGLFRFRPARNDAKASCLSLRKLTIDHFDPDPNSFFHLSIFVSVSLFNLPFRMSK